jgi:hypothetical protein
MQDDRGIIHYRNRAKQIRNFSGIRYGNITPSDLDFVIEYHDERRILCELKLDGVELPIGQRLLMERFVNDFIKAGKPSIAFVANHFVSDYTQDIDVGNAVISEVYFQYNGIWETPVSTMTVKELSDLFINNDALLFDKIYVL